MPRQAEAGHRKAGHNEAKQNDAGQNAPGQPELGQDEFELNGTEQSVTEAIQARLPGANWRERIGTAGTSMEQQRNSPIVELSMLLVGLITSVASI